MSERGAVRAGTRLRVVGYLAIWLLELVGQAGQVLHFLVRRRRIRERMHRAILEVPVPSGQSLKTGPAGGRQGRVAEQQTRED